VILHKHKTFEDDRGSFTPIPLDILGESWTQCSIGINQNEYTFRGLHYQTNPPQKKYVKVIQGSIIDFSVDIDTLDCEYMLVDSNHAVEIPSDKAHGYLTLEPNTIVSYLVQGEYNPESEHSIVWTTSKKVSDIVKAFVGDSELTISDKDLHGK
jgi:dTDP-4-dehydrorhamnose 3,5-epimerase